MLFGPLKGATAKGTPSSARDNPLTIEDGSENATRRQLVQVLLRDVLRRSGIPAHWIECQMMLVSSRTRGAGMYVRLVVKHWDDRLLNYAFAFQSELTRDLARFEPKAADWLHGISWELDVGDTCPYSSLPDKSFWQDADKKPLTALQQPITPTPNAADTTLSAASQPVALVKASPAFDVTQPFKVSGPNEDLEKLFAIRDRELAKVAGEELMPAGYEKTQPSPL